MRLQVPGWAVRRRRHPSSDTSPPPIATRAAGSGTAVIVPTAAYAPWPFHDVPLVLDAAPKGEPVPVGLRVSWICRIPESSDCRSSTSQ
jgi:hypothetical protein